MDDLPGMWEEADFMGGLDVSRGKFVIESVEGIIRSMNTDCQNADCNRPRQDFPMTFRDEPYCSDNCRKAIGLDLPQLDARH